MNLELKSKWLRNQILDTAYKTKHGHIGGAFSSVEILVSLFYGGVFRVGYDRFILSKGHACLALYPILADLGMIETGDVDKFCQNGCLLGGHPTHRIPGIIVDTGSLGHGLGIGCGLALSDKEDNDKRTFVLLGDGECQEGSAREAFDFGARFRLNNLTAIIDNNHQEVTSYIDTCIQYKIWGWSVSFCQEGNNVNQVNHTIELIVNRDEPKCLICETTKGKGVSFMEEELRWHHSIPTREEYELAKKELNGH